MGNIPVYKTNQKGVVARHLKNRETNKTYWRLYQKNEETGKFDEIGVKEESEIIRCELCRAVIIDKPNDRFCSEGCCDEFMRREQIDAEENEWSNVY